MHTQAPTFDSEKKKTYPEYKVMTTNLALAKVSYLNIRWEDTSPASIFLSFGTFHHPQKKKGKKNKESHLLILFVANF